MNRRAGWVHSLAAALIGTALLVATVPLWAVAFDDEPSGPALDPDYAAGKKAIEGKRWQDAIKALSSAALRDTRNADIQNYLGFAYRNAGDLGRAFEHYERALQLNPRHRGAHEYAGEAALITGDLSRAERHLAALKDICLLPCEEYDDLKSAIDANRLKKMR